MSFMLQSRVRGGWPIDQSSLSLTVHPDVRSISDYWKACFPCEGMKLTRGFLYACCTLRGAGSWAKPCSYVFLSVVC